MRPATSVLQIAIYADLCRPTPRVWTLLRAATVTERGGSTAVTIRVCFAAQMELRDRQAVFPGVHPCLKPIPMPGRSGRIPDLKPSQSLRQFARRHLPSRCEATAGGPPRFVEDDSAVHVLETQTMLLRCTSHLRSELARTIPPPIKPLANHHKNRIPINVNSKLIST